MKFKFIKLVGSIYFFTQTFLFSNSPTDTTLTFIGDIRISLSEFSERYSDYLSASSAEDNIVVREAILDNMINEIILYNFDSNTKIFSDKNYNDEIEWVWKQALLSYLKDREVYAKITVTDEELRDAFVKVNEKLAARHLFAATEEEAYDLYELLQSGFDFNILAQQVFTDSVLKNNGGYLGYFTWGDMDPAFEEVAYSLNVGEISKPVKTAYGYSIIRVDNRIQQPLLTEYEFQSKKSNLKRTLSIRKKLPYEKEFLSKVFDRNKLLFNNKSLENILGRLQLNRIDEINSVSKQSLETVCVEYDGKKYMEGEIENTINHIPIFHRKKIHSVNKLETVIEGLLIQEKLYNLALDKNYDKIELVLNTYEKLKKHVYLKYKMNEILDNFEINDSLAFAFYKENIKLFSSAGEINLQEIIVYHNTLADSLLVLLDAGEDFGNLAQQYSVNEWSAKKNGVLGYMLVNNLGVFADSFSKAEIGQVLGPFRIEEKYGIFKVLGRIDSKPINFELIKQNVIKAAKFELKTKIIREYINDLRKNIEIKVNHKLLNSFYIVG